MARREHRRGEAMSDTTPPSQPCTNAFRQCEDALDRFEDAWRRGQAPVLEEYLASETDGGLLREMVKVDLEWRLRQGRVACVEMYLRRFPALAADRAAVLDLVRAEWRLRLDG